MLDAVASLVDKSLLQRTRRENSDRFTMIETIREYGLERLAASGEVYSTRRAHAAYCIVLAEEGAAQVIQENTAGWLGICDAEHDNLRKALDWLVETDSGEWALRLGTALYRFWERREYVAEGRERLEAVLSLPSAAARTRERARALNHAGNLANEQGDYESAQRLHQEGLDIYSELGDRKGMAAQLIGVGGQMRWRGELATARPWYHRCVQVCMESGDRRAIAAALSNLADLVNEQGDRKLARRLFKQALSTFRELADWSGVGWSFNHLGDVARDLGQFEEARRLYHKGIKAFQTVGDQWGIGRSFADLGFLAAEQNDYYAAHSLFDQALRTFVGLDHRRGIAKVLEGFACVAIRQGDLERGLKLGGAAEGLRHTLGAPLRPAERIRLERVFEPAWGGGDPGVNRATWAQGRRMPPERAIQCALDWRQQAAAVTTGS
jgi:tetratricopeptide (TPR) repeat protein